ncbi:alpha-1,3-mannosyltransferase mnn1 [Saccharomyces pastorianus]|uniref:Alpha-1,3-mannosyltransferase mnn1 n=1 Tax=Saccharomyces pastorianus TaxID=27292 RepID=A0A6C1E5A7_SACPS|nr:alpha-1,3-mannosyltransferase mnn1 [Saccharomyces pastorianus]
MLALRRFILNRRSLRSCTIPILIGAVIIILGLFQLVMRRDDTLIQPVDSKNGNNAKVKSEDQKVLEKAFGSPVKDPVYSVPVSPLELVPFYDRFIDSKRKSSWLINKNSYYKHFNELSLDDRCKFYFRTLYTLDDDWTNSVHKLVYGINDDISDEAKELKKDSDGNPFPDEQSEKLYHRKYDMFLSFERIRAYDKCFMQNSPINIQDVFPKKDSKPQRESVQSKLIKTLNVTFPSTDTQNYKKYDQFEFERKMFPFVNSFTAETFHEIMPKITSPFGKVLEQGQLPKFNHETGKVDEFFEYEYDPTKTFWANWRDMSTKVCKRGIVLSLGSNQFALAVKFIASLRFQGNTLPIQIIYRGDELPQDMVEKLMYAARSPEFKPVENSYDNSTNVPQELWFLDVSNTVHPDWKNDFGSYRSKWLVVLFNLFQEFIFLDIDAISYQELDKYFESAEYQKTGTVFYRERSLNENVHERCIARYETLLPRKLESENFKNSLMFDAENVLNECDKLLTTEEYIFKAFFRHRRQHQLEAGLFAVDTAQHTIPLVLASMIHLAKHTSHCTHGDKENFWLGFLASGHPYALQKVYSGAIGDYVKKTDLNGKRQEAAVEICSGQIAHMSTDDKLLWVNGGGTFCKHENAAKSDWKKDGDFNKFKDQFKNFEEMEKYYYITPISSKYVILPDPKSDDWHRASAGACGGYIWCATHKTILKPYSHNERTTHGRLIEIDADQQARINAVNTVWSHANKDNTRSLTEDEIKKLDTSSHE